MRLVGLVSSYLEGDIRQTTIDPLLDICERVYVFEGPAGDPLPDADKVPPTIAGGAWNLVVHKGRWRTDARKRNAMLERAHEDFGTDQPVWGVIVDGDEALINGRFLLSRLQRLDWHEEVDPDVQYFQRPMRIVEPDGTVAWVLARLLRLDRIVSYKVSTSVFEVKTPEGVRLWTGGGNTPDLYDDWEAPRRKALEAGRMMMMPPLGDEPYLVHRSIYRHPLRSGLRMHEQERVELEAAGMEVPK